MRAPAFRSEHYRAQGMKPVYWHGLVIWLTTGQYDAITRSGDVTLVDATEEQIAKQDEWYEQALEEAREDARWIRSLGARLFGGGEGQS